MKVLVSFDWGVQSVIISNHKGLSKTEHFVDFCKTVGINNGLVIEKEFYPLHRINVIRLKD